MLRWPIGFENLGLSFSHGTPGNYFCYLQHKAKIQHYQPTWTAGMFAQTCYLVLPMLTFWVLLNATEGLVHITSLWVKHVRNGCEKAFYAGWWPFAWSFPHWLHTLTVYYKQLKSQNHLPSIEKLAFDSRLRFYNISMQIASIIRISNQWQNE